MPVGEDLITSDSQQTTADISPTARRFGVAKLAARFLLAWLASLCVIGLIALLVDVNWARPFIQSELGETLHRKVALGRLSWSFGLNGLAVGTKTLAVGDPEGVPLMNAGPSEIGIAIVPLFRGRLVIRHLDFDKPEFWMVRQADGKWNFADLLEYGPDIRFIRFEDGKVHVADQPKKGVKLGWTRIDLDHVKMEFVWPRKHHKTPFYLAFKRAADKYSTGIQITGLETGNHDRWQDNNLKFSCKASKLNLHDWDELRRTLLPFTVMAINGKNKPPEIGGLFDVNVDGEGIVSKGINANVLASAQQFRFSTPSLGVLEAPHTSTQAHLFLDPDKIQWSDLSLNAGEVQLKSQGELTNWQKKNSSKYVAHVNGNVRDLKTLSGMLSPANTKSQGKWSGHAEVEITLSGSDTGSKMETSVRAEDVEASDLVDRLPPDLKTFVNLVGLAPNSKVKGQIRIVPGERLEIKDAELPFGPGVVRTTGGADLVTQTSKFSFNGKNLALARIQAGLNDELRKGVGHKELDLPRNAEVKLGGSFDLNGDLETAAKSVKLSTTAVLNDASIRLSDGSFAATNLHGQVSYKNDKMMLDKISGAMGGGTFTLNGSIAKIANSKSAQLDLKFQAQSADMQHMCELLKILKVQLPVLSEKQLSGRVKELTLNITGKREAPQIYLAAVPEDMYYKPPGLKRPLRAKSGNIVYDHDNLTLTGVPLIMHNDTVTTGLIIEHLSGAAQLDSVHCKTSGVDLSDVHYYLASPLMPPPLKKTYTDFLKEYKLSAVHGRIHGDMGAEIHGDDVLLEGSVGLINVGAKAGAEMFPVEKLNGTLAANGDNLNIQDLTGTIRNSKFNLDGQVAKYRTDNPSWKAYVSATLEPRELLELVPALTDQFEQWNMKITASTPVELKAAIEGDHSQDSADFSASASAASNLAVSFPFGTLHQPKGETLALDGNVLLTPEAVKLSHTHLLIGDSVLNASGSILWRQPVKNKDGTFNPLSTDDMLHSGVDLKVDTPNPVPVRRLVLAVNPKFNKDAIKGSLTGKLALTGTIGQPIGEGKLSFQGMTIPNQQITDVTAEVALKELLADRTQKAELTVSTAKIRNLQLKDLSAYISITPNTEPLREPKLQISKGTCTAAGGTVNLSGWLDLDQDKLSLTAGLNGLKASELTESLLGQPGEVTGLTDGTVTVETQGDNDQRKVSNLSGSGHIVIRNGAVSRFGQLQTKLTQANLLHSGLFGFNFNNLLQSLYPVRTGRFRELSSNFEIDKGIVTIDQLSYNGDDMRLWAGGKANLPLDTIELYVSGKIPRVSESVLGVGPMGEVSRAFTLGKVMNVVTMHRLESLPALPLLGEIASNKPRTFSFKVVSPLDKPKLLTSSIEKTFHWMPSKPEASAHPLPWLH